MKMNFGS